MNARILRTNLAVTAFALVVLVSGACKRKDDAPPVATAPLTGASAPAGASAGDEWAWADSGAAPTAPAASTGSLDIEPSQPVTPAPRASAPRSTAPRSTAPRASAPRSPTNVFEDPPYGDDKPATAPAPAKVAYTAPAGSSVEVRLDTALDSETAQVGQAVSATLDADLTDGAGHVVLPRGTRLTGTVTEAVSAKKVKKKSSLAYQLTSAQLPDGTTVAIAAGQRLEGKGYTKKDGAIIGGSAAGGAVLGQILGGDTESTAAGAILGGAIGSGVAMSKKGEDVVVEAGTMVALTMERPITIER